MFRLRYYTQKNQLFFAERHLVVKMGRTPINIDNGSETCIICQRHQKNNEVFGPDTGNNTI